MSEPTVEVEQKETAVPARRGVRFWVRRVVWTLVVIGMIPVLLTFLYLAPFVHPVSTLMVQDLITFRGYDRQWVEFEDISPLLVRSVIMSEDGQFCSHRGVDWAEMNVVIDDLLDGSLSRGASTIPMQTVKNLYLWHRPLGAVRKVLEVPLAIYFDLVLSKRRIIEIYLNIAEWGPGIYGIEAASQAHFGRAAAKLTARQAALLAVTLPNPIDRDPANPSNSMSRLANVIQKRAAGAGSHVACLY
ncbi:MAG: biosynthetic peptidoglycan transglycosylase [Rhizobiaceae bacterium]